MAIVNEFSKALFFGGKDIDKGLLILNSHGDYFEILVDKGYFLLHIAPILKEDCVIQYDASRIDHIY